MVKIVVVVDENMKEWFEGDVETIETYGKDQPVELLIRSSDSKKPIAMFKQWFYWREVKE